MARLGSPDGRNPPASNTERGDVAAVIGLVGTATLAAWGIAVLAFRGNAVLMGTASLAYGFGLRHAVDADHIAAIDNVTRKLRQQGKRSATAGFFFALGHSTVVVLASFALVSTSLALKDRFAALKAWGGLIGTGVSALFLFAVAIANLAILVGLYRSARQLRPNASLAAADLDRLLAGRGLLSGLLRPIFAMISQSWQMYPLGFLFGLGFDTATEIALLDVSATEATQGLAIALVMVFPMLFTVGMLLADTLDGIVMTGAYGWAVSNPVRTFYYNLTITSASVMVALTVGGIEVLGLIGQHLGGDGEFRRAVVWMNDNLGNFGFIIIAVFAASWLVSVGMSRWKSGVEIANGR